MFLRRNTVLLYHNISSHQDNRCQHVIVHLQHSTGCLISSRSIPLMASAQSKSCGHHCCILMFCGPSSAPTVTGQWQECPKDTQKCAGKQQGAGGICDSFRLHSQLVAAEPRAKSAWHVSDITGYFSCSHWTLGEVTDIYGLWGLDCVPLTPKGMTGHYQKQDLDVTLLGDALKAQYKKTHLA